MKIGPKLCSYSAGYYFSRKLGIPRLLPINITVSVTFKCNSRCKTCFIWKKYPNDSSTAKEELKIDEFEEIFRFLGKNPVWFTLSGGEPFLRSDIVEICESICRNNDPHIINIPTNAILTGKILKDVKQILEVIPKNTTFIFNLSLDGIGEKHNEIRGHSNNFDKFLKTFEGLKTFREDYSNFRVGVHTVLSVLNYEYALPLYEYVINELRPDQYITEVAEEREELGTIGVEVTPHHADYEMVIDDLSNRIKKDNTLSKDFSVFVQALRMTYYDVAKKILTENKQIIPCFAGLASCHITPHGDVWACATKAESIGNLREVDYDLSKIWFGKRANNIRKTIKAGECFCPLANTSFTNIMCNFESMLKVLKNMAHLKLM